MSSRRATIAAPEASEAFFAALIAASREDCDCKTCKILKKLADSIVSKYE
jgi:hypothetical protein